MNRGKYAYVVVFVKYTLGKSSCSSKIPPVVPKKLRITVSVFLSTLQLTALLLKSFHLRLHCYTLVATAATVPTIFQTKCDEEYFSMVYHDVFIAWCAQRVPRVPYSRKEF